MTEVFQASAFKGYGTVKVHNITEMMYRTPYFIPTVISQGYNNFAPVQSILSAIGGVTIPNKPTLIPTEIYRWLVNTGRVPLSTILSYTGGLTPGKGRQGRIELSDGFLDDNATIKLKDGRTILFLDKKSATGRGFAYDYQVVGTLGQPDIDASLLAPTSEVSFVTSIHPEGSSRAQNMGWLKPGGNAANVLQIERAKAKLTGSAMAEAVRDAKIFSMPVKTKSGKDDRFYASLPDIKNNTGESLLGFILAMNDRSMIDGVGNFDATTGNATTVDDEGNQVFMMNGLRAQLQAANQYQYSPTDPLRQILFQIKSICRRYSDYMGAQEMVDLFVFGHSPAEELFSAAVLSEYANGGAPVLNHSDGNEIKLSGFKRLTTYQVGNVLVKFVVVGPNTVNQVADQQIYINGIAANARDFEMMFIPVMREAEGKLSLQLLAKGEGNVDRSLVMGTLDGIFGQTPTGVWHPLASAQDAKTYEVLTHRGIALTNAHQCSLLQPLY